MTIFFTVAPEVFTKGVIGAAEGGPVRLECEAKAYPTAMVEWMRNGNIVTTNGAWKVNETDKSIFETSKILIIRRAEPRLMGKYACRASNSIGVAEAGVQVYRECYTVSFTTSESVVILSLLAALRSIVTRGKSPSSRGFMACHN